MNKAIKRPNLFIVGAAKAGTTSLYYYLNQHPEVFLSPLKEPNFFSTDINPDNFSSTYIRNNKLDYKKYFEEKPLKKLQLSFIRKFEYYQQLFEGVDQEKIIGECSTSYLYSTKAAENIYRNNPDSRIIIILRNPIERAFSHYLMALRYGYTNLMFREALEKELRLKKKGWGISELFLELGMYYNQIKRYYDVFGKERVLILLFDDLETDLNSTLQQTFDFLNIQGITIKNSEAQNSAKIPRFKKLNKFFVHSGIKNLSNRMLPTRSRERLKTALFRSASNIRIDKQDQEFLLGFFKEDIEKTSVLIDRDLTKWVK